MTASCSTSAAGSSGGSSTIRIVTTFWVRHSARLLTWDNKRGVQLVAARGGGSGQSIRPRPTVLPFNLLCADRT